VKITDKEQEVNDVLEFPTTDQMHEHLARSTKARLHPLQAALGPGSHWVQFHDVAKRDVRFGTICSDETIFDLLTTQSGMTDEVAHATVTNLASSHDLGVYYGLRHDRRHTGGVMDVVYLGRSWPIEKRLFDAAREVSFDIDRLPDWGRILLQAAFIACRYHVRSAEAAGE
jgi:hypothetical protein